MSATGYNIDIRDIRFVLFEQLKAHERLAVIPKFADFDLDIYNAMLEEGARISTEVIWPINCPGDQEGCTLDKDGNVTTPKGYKEAWRVQGEGGWIGFSAPMELGGAGLPDAIAMGVAEMLTGACNAMAAYGGLSRGAANLLRAHGPQWLQDLTLKNLYSGIWGGTMCLTEAGAGSSVGDNRCRATPAGEPGVYHLEGEKIFITGGDQDMTENIIHLVLARVPGAPSGTKGLSIFAVPKWHFDGRGRNGAKVVGIEHKMGLKGSATCTLALGAEGPCVGYLLGRENDGMRIMFHMMNEARIAVAVQALSSAAAAYLNALSYAKERVQGTSLKDMNNGDADRVTIINHPDVRRMLLRMKVTVETLRSLIYTVGLRHTLAENLEDADERQAHMNIVELLTPICKSLASDLGFEVCVTALQTFGGYGYIGEYPVEQHVRDNKIASIYEGTNGIQAMDLLGRKMRRASGALFMQWLQEANEVIDRARASGKLDAEIEPIEKARDSLGAAAMHLGGVGMTGALDEVMLHAVPFQSLFGTVAMAVHALEQADVAQAALDAGAEGEDAAFYKGKVLNLKFFVNQLLPQATALSKSIRSGDTSALDPALFA